MEQLSSLLASKYSNLSQRPLQSGECQTLNRKQCTLCHAGKIDYATELKHKQQAIIEFWNSLETKIALQIFIPSPFGRNYRTVSKRKAFLVNKRFSLGLIGVDEESARSFPFVVGQCVIEPHIHSHVYRTVQEYLQKKENLSLAEEFNYVIAKGNDAEAIVIFNMNHFSSANRKEINHLSKHLTSRVKNILGIFIFVDEERSRYYLPGSPKKAEHASTRPLTKIFGKEKLFHKIHDVKFLYSALSFSQTNHSILESFVSTVGELLSLAKNDTLLDLYCGYGLFSICLAKKIKNVVGLELSRSSINDAIENAQRNKISNARFITTNITPENLRRYIKPETQNLKFLLDPPRNGTTEGVIEFLAAQQPEKVVHIFCNSEIIEKELKRWHNGGYQPAHAVAFDMFPGASEIELMIELVRKS